MVRYATLPHLGDCLDAQVVEAAMKFNNPPVIQAFDKDLFFKSVNKGLKSSLTSSEGVFKLSHLTLSDSDDDISGSTTVNSQYPCEGVILETVKPGYEDSVNSIVFRLYESRGGYASNVWLGIHLLLGSPLTSIRECNLLEYDLPSTSPCMGSVIGDYIYFRLGDFDPFKIRSFKCCLV